MCRAPHAQGYGSGPGCPPAIEFEGLPSCIEGPCWPTVLGICPQYSLLQITIMVVTIMIIVAKETVGVPSMILSVWDMGLVIKTHSFFRRENGF